MERYFKNIKKQWILFLNSYYMSKTIRFIENNEIYKANDLIDKIDIQTLNDDFYKYFIYKGFILFKLEKFSESIYTFEESLLRLKKSHIKKKLTSNDYIYLCHYCYSFLLYIYYIKKNKKNFKIIESKIKELSYDINNVNSSLVESYPINKNIEIFTRSQSLQLGDAYKK